MHFLCLQRQIFLKVSENESLLVFRLQINFEKKYRVIKMVKKYINCMIVE